MRRSCDVHATCPCLLFIPPFPTPLAEPHMVKIALPPQMAGMAAGARQLSVSAQTLPEVFDALDQQAPMLRSQIIDSSGAVRQFIGLFLDDEQVLDVNDASIQVRSGSQLTVVMSVAGG